MLILVKLASRSRPARFLECVWNIANTTEQTDNTQLLVSLDEDDGNMSGFLFDSSFPLKTFTVFGLSRNKVHAMNRDIETVNKWDILVVASDDMRFETDWDMVVRGDMTEDLDCVLHYNDGYQRDEVMTLSIIGRRYYDRFGYVYHPDYQAVWCDNEAMEVAKRLGKYKYLGDDKQIFTHCHPLWGWPTDALYEKWKRPAIMGDDKKTFERRKSIGFLV